MNESDRTDYLQVHVILSVTDCALIKIATPNNVGKIKQPIAENTRVGWIIKSPGQDDKDSTILYPRTTQEDYMEMYNLNILSSEDKFEGDRNYAYEEFKE